VDARAIVQERFEAVQRFKIDGMDDLTTTTGKNEVRVSSVPDGAHTTVFGIEFICSE